MNRVPHSPRENWQQIADDYGFKFHTFDGEPYWEEGAFYQFSLAQVENDLEDPTQEIHDMVMDLVPEILASEEKLTQLAIPSTHWDYIKASWDAGHPHLYGRMDLSYDGKYPAKLLELNYDTPTSLYEAAFFQWLWLEDQLKLNQLPTNADQWNTIQENIIEVLTELKSHISPPLYFASAKESLEDRGTVDYLRDCAEQAGIKAAWLALEDIGVDPQGRLTDLADWTITSLFKLYPWEDLLREEFSVYLKSSQCLLIEPAWKALLSNKGILPLLWDKHQNHPNLLESYFISPDEKLAQGWVHKPLHSREGANISLFDVQGNLHVVEGPYEVQADGHGMIRQKLAPLAQFDSPYGPAFALIGAWVIADRACGMGIREDASPITKDSSRFVPHIILD